MFMRLAMARGETENDAQIEEWQRQCKEDWEYFLGVDCEQPSGQIDETSANGGIDDEEEELSCAIDWTRQGLDQILKQSYLASTQRDVLWVNFDSLGRYHTLNVSDEQKLTALHLAERLLDEMIRREVSVLGYETRHFAELPVPDPRRFSSVVGFLPVADIPFVGMIFMSTVFATLREGEPDVQTPDHTELAAGNLDSCVIPSKRTTSLGIGWQLR